VILTPYLPLIGIGSQVMHACNSIRVYIKMFDYMFVHVFEAHQIQVVSKETRSNSCKSNDKHSMRETRGNKKG